MQRILFKPGSHENEAPVAYIHFVNPLFSCKDKDSSWVQVKSIENEIYHSIKAYRESKDLSGPFVHQYLMVEEAQLYSYKMASGLIARRDPGSG